MDHLAHRKRKANSDDQNDSSTSHTTSNAPRHPWLASGNDWSPPQVSSPLSSDVSFSFPPKPTKRPRLERIETSFRHPRRHSPSSRKSSLLSCRPSPLRPGNDIEDIGVVSTAHPGPSTGSLLDLRAGPKLPEPGPSSPSPVPLISIDTNSPHIPSFQPLINRQTLKELDLDTILRNPQLRHDLLFDPGLQFRPTCSRRKRDMSEKYWNAIIQEIETGCTCVSFDMHGKPHSLVCACSSVPHPPSSPVVAYSSCMNGYTLRMPSRIRRLLTEFLEVLLLVIQPLSSISGMYVNPDTFKAQMQEHTAQAAYIRSIFDPVLIEQELEHEVFDPSGLFHAIGTTLKGHCAPMRDRAVETMVQAAQACAPRGPGTKQDAVKAVRMCMEILELMKLDIANHQLQTLRPFLIRTSGQFELKTLKNHKGGSASLRMTQEWLRVAHNDMLTRGPLLHPRYTSGSLKYDSLPRNQQIYLAVLRGILGLVFNPPPASCASSVSSSDSPIPVFQTLSEASSSPYVYPETLYLDSARLALLNAEAADATALSMFLLLYRQLIFSESSEPSSSTQGILRVVDADLIQLKREIRDIGPSRLGDCFSSRLSSDELDGGHGNRSDRKEAERWLAARQGVVLQIAKRAKEARNRTHTSSSSQPSSPIGEVPDGQMANLAQRWADSNMHADSTLALMLRRRLQDIVFNTVVKLAYPAPDSNTFKRGAVDFFTSARAESVVEMPLGTATGMEPLTDEIRALSEKISRLALIHLNAFLPLYEQEGFLGLM